MPERGRESGVLDDDGCVASAASSRSCYVPREHERKARREIANSNERRRMQSINAGFQSLRKMLQPRDGDKLSKASVLQKAVEYIYALERDRNCLLSCNARLMCRLRAALGRDVCDLEAVDDLEFCDFTSAAKRHKMDIESSDEGIGGMLSPPRCNASEAMSTDGHIVDGVRRQVCQLQRQLDSERKSRMIDIVTSRPHRDHHHRPAVANSAALPGGAPPRRGSLETIVEPSGAWKGHPRR